MPTLCNLEHEVFDVIGNSTRRKIMRLLACEHNYGNQIASILDVSRPTVHRHLKSLQDHKSPFVIEKEKTKESYSGYKGGEASIYHIDRRLNLFLTLMPKFLHSHIIEVDPTTGKMTEAVTTKEENPFKGYIPPASSDDQGIAQYISHYDDLKQLNEEIIDLEKQLVMKMMKKNDLMEKVDDLVADRPELNFHQRIILRAIACLGPDCVKDLPALLNLERIMVEHYLDILSDKNWLNTE